MLSIRSSALFLEMMSFCGKAAPISAFAVTLSPIPTLKKVALEKNTGNLPLLPYSSMISNGFVWVVYGLLKSEQKIWITNLAGVILGLYYSYEYSKYCPKNATNLPGTFSQHIKTVLCIVTFTLVSTFSLSREAATALVGIEGVFFCVVLFASPLSAMRAVIQTRSAKSIPLPFTLFSLLNCTLWSIVGIFEMNDIMVYVPNLLGFFACVAQLALIVIFGKDVKSPVVYRAGESNFIL